MHRHRCTRGSYAVSWLLRGLAVPQSPDSGTPALALEPVGGGAENKRRPSEAEDYENPCNPEPRESTEKTQQPTCRVGDKVDKGGDGKDIGNPSNDAPSAVRANGNLLIVRAGHAETSIPPYRQSTFGLASPGFGPLSSHHRIGVNPHRSDEEEES